MCSSDLAVYGPDGYFWCLAIVHGAIGAFALYRMTMRPAVPLDDQSPYVPVTSQATPIALRDAMDVKPPSKTKKPYIKPTLPR